jgi:HTH-type transcriptional repressor of NAD biosynthesis genes
MTGPDRGVGMTASRKQFRRGLVVGKFSPLHRGHELVIQRAMDTCDEVVIISYTKPEFAGCDRTTRQAWVEALFPLVTALVVDDDSLGEICTAHHISPSVQIPHNDENEAVHREFVGWLCWTVLNVTVDAVFTSEDYGDGFAAVLTEYFAGRTTPVAPVRHICVDQARNLVPVSGTQARSNPVAWRDFLSPQVYASFVKRACILGGESSGKTTLARSVADHLGTAWVPEYGREYWERTGGHLQFEDMLHIATQQIEQEIACSAKADHWLLCDTSPLTTLFYSLEMFGTADAELERLAARPYDRIFLCAPDFPFVQDGTRRDEHLRARQHRWYIAELSRRKIPFRILYGPNDDRVSLVCSALLSVGSASTSP